MNESKHNQAELTASQPKQASGLERQQQIVRLTEQQGRISVQALAAHFAVSEVTIRTDLARLQQKQLLVRSRGYALVNTALRRELSLKEKRQCFSDLKIRLGQAAAALIQDGDRVLLDSGTTTQQVAVHLHERKQLIVMTNGLNVASELAQCDDIDLLTTGGLLRKKSMSFYGPLAEASLRDFHFHKLVLGVDACSVAGGLSTHFEQEAQLNRQMVQQANQVIVVTDSSKFGQQAFHRICDWRAVHVLVTDDGLEPAVAATLTELGIRLVQIKQQAN